MVLLAVVSLAFPLAVTFHPAMPADSPSTELSADPRGWAYHPAIASGPDGVIYAAWSQHTRPEDWQLIGTYVKRWANGSWVSLGGRIGHTPGEKGAQWPEGYAPALAVVGRTPYVAWYEGGGYGWGEIQNRFVRTSVFVAHWNGNTWVVDRNPALPNGALNSSTDRSARTPALAVVGGVLHAAWIESRSIPSRGSHRSYNAIGVKRLTGDRWEDLGQGLSAEQSEDDAQILHLAIADLAGVPYIAWTERAVDRTGRPLLHVAKWSGARWRRVGRELSVSRAGYVNFVGMTSSENLLYIAWQERTLTGNTQIYVKSWNGSDWVALGGSLNVDTANGEAGRPALASHGGRVWLAWAEGPPGQPSGLYLRSLASQRWSAPVGPLNRAPGRGAADTPALAATEDWTFLVWAEKDPPPATKLIYVRLFR